MAKSEYPLETFVRHILLRRLALTTAVITLGVALISYAVQRHSIETRIVEVARAQIALLLTRTRAIASAQSLNPHEAFRRALTEFGDTKTSGTAGSFVWTRFYGPDLSFIAEDVDRAYAHREEAAAFVRRLCSDQAPTMANSISVTSVDSSRHIERSAEDMAALAQRTRRARAAIGGTIRRTQRGSAAAIALATSNSDNATSLASRPKGPGLATTGRMKTTKMSSRRKMGRPRSEVQNWSIPFQSRLLIAGPC